MSTFSDLSHFGMDRTNAAQAPPRPSKRAPAGGMPGSGNTTSSVRTLTPTAPAGMNHNAPAFVPPGGVTEAVWGAPAGFAAPVTTTPPQSQSPVAQGDISTSSGASSGTMPTAAQLEGFKSMVLQMAQFFQQYPEANVVPSQMGNLFSQMSLQSQHPSQGSPSSTSPHGAPTSGSRGSSAQAPQAGFPPQPFELLQAPAECNVNGPYTASQTSPQRQQRPVSVSAVEDSQLPSFGAPKPNRRAFAQAQQHHHSSTLPSYETAAMAPVVSGYDPLMSAFQSPAAETHNHPAMDIPPSFHQSQQGRPNHRGNQRQGGGGPRTRNQGGPFVSNVPDTEPKIIVLVEFKRQRMKKYESDVFVAPGHYVVVEGDRGVDCGFVIHCCIREPDGTFSRQESIDNVQIDVNRIKSESGRVLRLARDDDVKLLHTEIASSELLALKTCRELAARMNLSMEIVDCEYQFDRKKISFYFDAPHSVDFRELNTELFRVFGVRIWLENLNSKVKNVVPDGALSHADKLQYTKNGLRPPRRT